MAEYVKRCDVSMACYNIFEEVVREYKPMTAEEVKQTMLRFEKAINQTPAADVVPKSEVAMEIFEEIDELLSPYGTYIKTIDLEEYAELKKKYTEEYHEISRR